MTCHCLGTLINPKCPEHGSMQRLREEIERLSAENSALMDVYREAKHMRDESGVFMALHEAIERVPTTSRVK